MGSIDRLQSGRYKARYRGPDGRARSKTFDRKSDALAFLNATGADIRRGAWVDPALSRMSFQAWVENWKVTTVHLRDSTLHIHQRELPALLDRFGATPLASITAIDVRAWMAEQLAAGLGASRINRRYRLLRQILNSAVETDRIAKNPCRAAKPPPVPRNEMRFLTEDEVAELAEAIHPWYRTWVYFAAYTGLRWAEQLGLRRMDVDLVHRRVTVVQQITEVQSVLLPPSAPKTKASRRSVDIPPSLCALLDEQLAERAQAGYTGLVFVNTVGHTPHASTFSGKPWRRARRITGLDDVRWHDLRHTAVALAIQEGAHPNAIKERMGHSSITVTLDRYGHLFPSLGRELAAGLEARLAKSLGQKGALAPVLPIGPPG